MPLFRRARREFSDACRDFATQPEGIYRLDLPTGGGKTLSSLRFSVNHAALNNKRRIIYVAPLLTIIEQNARAIQRAIGNEETLLHYSNVAEDMVKEDELNQRELLQESWESKVIITSLVQLLQTLFSGKMSSVRRFNALANSVIVFDEIQSLPIKVYSMFNLAMNFLSKFCHSTIVLCSATLPTFDRATYQMDISRKHIISDDLLERTSRVFKRTNIQEWPGEVRYEEISDVVLSQMENSESTLVVCNKKSEASFLFNDLKKKAEGVKLYHLSAGMCPLHRKDTLKAITDSLKKHEKIICVSTQVIEAGIDISFSCVFRFAAGIDNVIQAAGRCNRNGESEQPCNVYILRVAGESLKMLTEIRKSKEALLNLLTQFKEDSALYDDDLASLGAINYYYDVLLDSWGAVQDYPNPEGNKPTLLLYLSDNLSVVENGIKHRDKDDFLIRQSFKTAGELFSVFDSEQKTVIVPYNDEARKIIAELQAVHERDIYQYANTLLCRSKNYNVSIFDYTFDNLCKKDAIIKVEKLGVYCLKTNFYDKDIGVTMGD